MRRLLTQNGELREIGVWNWSIPAWVVELSDGTKFNTCPSAGACAKFCYARNGTYNFPAVKAAHLRNLEMILDDRDAWTTAMVAELNHKRYRPTGTPRDDVAPPGEEMDPWMYKWHQQGGRAVRIHDAGDFFDADYLRRWMTIARYCPDVLFYAYTKEVQMFREVAVPEAPDNFRWIYSMGGRQDHLIDLDNERHAEVFPDVKAIEAAGYRSQDASDLYAITLQTAKVGIPANNIRHYNKKMAGATFGELQAGRHKRLPILT